MKLNRVRLLRRLLDLQKSAGDDEVVDEDRLSKLPDEVLLHILDMMNTLDAIRTCIVSKRMRSLLPMLSQIVILLGSRDWLRMNGVVADVTDKMLRTRSPQIGIRKLKFRFLLRLDDCLSIGKTVAFAMATQKLDAAEFEISTQTSSVHYTRDDLLYFAEQFNTFLGACPDAFAGLTRLHLQDMSFRETDIPNILSTCKRLESLRLFHCDAGSHSGLKVEHAGLVELDITLGRFTTLELIFLPKLEELTYYGWLYYENPLVLGFVPRLSKLNLSNKVISDKTLVLSNLLVSAPSISKLHLDFQSEKIWVQPEGPKLLARVLRKLRTVDLENVREGCDIAWTMFILEAAPYLEDLCVTVSGHRCPMDPIFSEKRDVKWEPSPADRKHTNLAKLTIHGFQSHHIFTGYVRRIMECAVNIKEVSLHDWKVCKRCTERKVDIKEVHLSGYPQTAGEKDLLRKMILEGLVMTSVKHDYVYRVGYVIRPSRS
ncbi:unnamed protein product [Alopecurus aequalis]